MIYQTSVSAARSLLPASLLLCLCVSAVAQTGSGSEPVRYVGGVSIDPTVHDGRLRPAIGVENRQVMRANRTHPEWADDQGWTYNHAPMLAYWNGKFYLEYLSNPVGEHIAPGQTLVTTSTDGRNWSKPVVVFPPCELPEGGTAMMHQRMGFHVASNGRLLVLAFYGHAPNPFGKGGIGRVVREAYRDGSYGPIYFIRYSRHAGWNEKNTRYPSYKESKDAGFVEACEALLSNRLVTLNWWQEDQSDDDFYALKGNYQAFCYYHRNDGKVVGLWKWSLAALSSDEGGSWTTPVRVPTLIMDGAKVWGQRTRDHRFALVYNPVDDSLRRYPLAIVSGDDGILFDNMLTVHGEVPPRRFVGQYKDFGAQYVRGIAEGNGMPPGDDMWITYSLNKEDIWVTRIPVPARYKVERPVMDRFDTMKAGRAVTDWNIYSPQWAPVAVVNFPSSVNKSLQFDDRDPFDYAKAVRTFPESPNAEVGFRVYAKQNDTGRFEVEVLDRWGNRPVRLAFGEEGHLTAISGGSVVNLADYRPNTWYSIRLTIDARAGRFSVSMDGKPVLRDAPMAEFVRSVERLSFRTGAYRTEPTRRMNPEQRSWKDLNVADEPVRTAAYYIDDVEAGSSKPSSRPPEPATKRTARTGH